MEALMFIFLCCIWIGLIIGLPTILAIYIYRRLAKKGHKKLGLSISTLVIATLIFYIYTAFYPLESFYKEDFEYYTKLTFPNSGKILSKEASYPDIHGKYCSDALIEVSVVDYKSLIERVTKDKTFIPDSSIGNNSEYFSKVTKNINSRNIVKTVRKGKMFVAFLNDGKTIILERALW